MPIQIKTTKGGDRVPESKPRAAGEICKLDPARLEKIETTLDLILRELAEIKGSLTQSANSQEPEAEGKKSKKRVLYS